MSILFRGVGLLPNLLTTGTLFCGYYAILLVMRGDHQAAFGYIVLAAVFDLLDGYVARILRAQSDFGAQLDSLSDAVAFGVAPALLLFDWLQKINHIYTSSTAEQTAVLIPAVYLLCVIFRLARFNVTLSYHKYFFTGAPSPACALAVCALISLSYTPLVDLREHMYLYNALLVSAVGIISMLMISRLPYPSFKGGRMSKKLMPFVMILLLLLIALSVMEIRWPLFLALAYIVLVAFWHLGRSTSRFLANVRRGKSPTPPQ
ncbi:MAG: CDP-diacylglycerol--serine O-phosphatidyltransferase [Proteobacteria bacterium]|nr:CDP-diacylglycerol--serine O-phosphatidyltransferase [Pseudomonadota bacterium]